MAAQIARQCEAEGVSRHLAWFEDRQSNVIRGVSPRPARVINTGLMPQGLINVFSGNGTCEGPLRLVKLVPHPAYKIGTK
jgi:hypothetical protein